MDDTGMVIDLELAKNILLEYFTTGEYEYAGINETYKDFLKKIQTDLIYNGDYFTFKDNEDYTYFGGPEGSSGYWIQEMSEWLKERKLTNCWSVNGLTSDLNNENKVFYEIEGDLKCFIIHEGD